MSVECDWRANPHREHVSPAEYIVTLGETGQRVPTCVRCAGAFERLIREDLVDSRISVILAVPDTKPYVAWLEMGRRER